MVVQIKPKKSILTTFPRSSSFSCCICISISCCWRFFFFFSFFFLFLDILASIAFSLGAVLTVKKTTIHLCCLCCIAIFTFRQYKYADGNLKTVHCSFSFTHTPILGSILNSVMSQVFCSRQCISGTVLMYA